MDEGFADQVAQFISITGASTQKAESYLKVSDFDLSQALQLFFDTGGADIEDPLPSSPPSHLPPRQEGSSSSTVRIDDDDEIEDEDVREAIKVSKGENATYEDDEAMARRLQEEFFNGDGEGSSGMENGVRAPIASTRETLVGPEEVDYGFPSRFRPDNNGPAGIFRQRTTVWHDRDPSTLSPEDRYERLVNATGGAAAGSSRAGKLANLFRPPVEIMAHLTFDDARDEAKELEKWMLINIQDPSIFASQVLNRDIWKAPEVQQTVKENFIFLQMDRDGRDGRDYIRLYIPEAVAGISNDLFPHIGIVDPRTGELVKVWTTMPNDSLEFVHTLHEFLERYSLRVDAKNPVQRKSKPKTQDISRLTEEEMMQIAMENSLGSGASNSPHGLDPDALTKEGTDSVEIESLSEPKGKEVEKTPFQMIPRNNHHQEPPQGPDTTRIQFKLHDGSRKVRRFLLNDPVVRLFEYVKADLLPEIGADHQEFELVSLGKRLIDVLDQTVESTGLKMGTVMVETMEN